MYHHWECSYSVSLLAVASITKAVESELESEAVLVLLESDSVKVSRLWPQYKFQRLLKSQKSYFLNMLYFHQREL
jgi:hypothetical protein